MKTSVVGEVQVGNSGLRRGIASADKPEGVIGHERGRMLSSGNHWQSRVRGFIHTVSPFRVRARPYNNRYQYRLEARTTSGRERM